MADYISCFFKPEYKKCADLLYTRMERNLILTSALLFHYRSNGPLILVQTYSWILFVSDPKTRGGILPFQTTKMNVLCFASWVVCNSHSSYEFYMQQLILFIGEKDKRGCEPELGNLGGIGWQKENAFFKWRAAAQFHLQGFPTTFVIVKTNITLKATGRHRLALKKMIRFVFLQGKYSINNNRQRRTHLIIFHEDWPFQVPPLLPFWVLQKTRWHICVHVKVSHEFVGVMHMEERELCGTEDNAKRKILWNKAICSFSNCMRSQYSLANMLAPRWSMPNIHMSTCSKKVLWLQLSKPKYNIGVQIPKTHLMYRIL